MTRSDPALAERLQQLEAAFRHVAATSMRGLPMCHPRLDVAAVGFVRETVGGAALGVLVTPWCMNLLRLPLDEAAADAMPALGHKLERDCGERRFEFIGAQMPGLGRFEMCSLFSPMFEFSDQAAALGTAREVLALIRTQPTTPSAAKAAMPVPSRRGFLFGAASTGQRT